MRRAVWCLTVVVALCAGWGFAQPPSITGPPDRFVAPGGFVTLVFRLEATSATEVDVTVDVDLGWSVVRPPGRVELRPDQSVPIAVTVEVPADTPAGAVARVTLEVVGPNGTAERTVELGVTERADVTLQAPAEVTIVPEGLGVEVANAGNVPEVVTVAFQRDGVTLDREDVALGPGAQATVRFELAEEGLHEVVLTTERGLVVRRTVRVLRFGSPADDPFTLSGEVAVVFGASGRRGLEVGLRGALSDFTTVDARVDGGTLDRSFAEARAETWSVRLGSGWRDPYGLQLPGDLGVGATWTGERWSASGQAGWLGEDRFGASVAAGWYGDGTEVAGAIGVRAGRPLLAVRWEANPNAALSVLAAGGFRAGVLDASLQTDLVDGEGSSRVSLEGRDLAGSTARVSFGVRHRLATAEVYGDATAPLTDAGPWQGRFGFRETLVTPLPGALDLSAQWGTAESFARLGYRSEFRAGWRGGATAGVRQNAEGFGVTLDLTTGRSGTDPVDVDARLVYLPESGALTGQLGARTRFLVAPVDLGLALGWNIDERDVAVGTNVAWSDDAWSLALDATVGVGYADATRWRADVTFSGAYAFDLAVPEALVTVAGGRRVGFLEGRVATAVGEGVADVVLSVGRYRALTDADGRFRLTLTPGRYTVVVDVATVPVAYRLTGDVRADVEIALRSTTTFDVPVVLGSALVGRLLEDRDGDDVADEPARGVVARVLITDADGLGRVTFADAEGRFEMRALPPGATRIEVFDLPRGASVVGDAIRSVTLAPAAVEQIDLTVRSVPTAVRSFGAATLRIRGVDVEVARVPAGAAPLVRVEVVGEPRSVQVATSAGTIDLAALDGVWIGRVPVPSDAPPGVLPFSVQARSADGDVERRGQLVVDPEAPAVLVTGDAPLRPGETLRVEVTAYFAASTVRGSGPFGEVPFVEGEPGRWSGQLVVPADAVDAVEELTVTVVDAEGREIEETYRFRVLAP